MLDFIVIGIEVRLNKELISWILLFDGIEIGRLNKDFGKVLVGVLMSVVV